MLRVDQDANTHLNPNPFLTLEMTTIQMAVTRLQWPCHLHATQVRHSLRKKIHFIIGFSEHLGKSNVIMMNVLTVENK